MLQILQDKSVLTMTSREISDLVNSRHADVCKSIDKLSDKGVISRYTAEPYTSEQNGQTYYEYYISKRDSYVIVAQFSPEFTAALVDRWQALESQVPAPVFNIPQTLPEALRLAADLADQLAVQAPMVEVYKLLADRKGDVSTTIIAKELGTTAIKLNKFLRDSGMKWLNADLPKAGYEKYFNVVADVKNGHEFTQCLVTPEGQIAIAKLWSEQ